MAHPDDRPSSRGYTSRRSAPRHYDDTDGEEYYRRQEARDPRNDVESTNGRTHRRNDYDGSDEDDAPPPQRHRREDRPSSVKNKAQFQPDIPPPPLGEDRRSMHKNKDDRARNASGPGSEDAEDDVPSSHKSKPSRRDQYEDTEPAPNKSRRHKERDYAEAIPRRRSHKTRDEYDEPEPRRHSSGRDRDRTSHYDAEPPRRSKSTRSSRDDYDRPRRSKSLRDDYPEYEAPRRSKPPRDAYDELPRRKSYTRDRRNTYPDDDDSEPEYERPRRRRAEKPSRYDDGYGTDRPKRQPRDDYDRGYRTDGREPRRDRDRRQDRREPRDQREPPRRDGRHRDDDDEDDDYHDDYDRKHHSKKKSGHSHDYREMFEKGKKNWKTVEPVAKPLITTLANAYLKNGRGG